MKHLTTIFALFLFVFGNAQEYATDRLIIQTKHKFRSQTQFNNPGLEASVTNIKPLFEKANIYLVDLKDSYQLESTISLLQTDENVKYISKDYKLASRSLPNDPFFFQQENLNIINAPDVWERTTGGKNVNGDDIVVAIIDNGFDIFHEDLVNNIWTNPGEIDNDNIDNDNNGFTDDFLGLHLPSKTDDHLTLSHGTNVAGIIGAEGDNDTGITGINWDIKLMLLSTSPGPGNDGFVSDVIKAYEYVEFQRTLFNESDGAQGAFIVASNSSFGRENALPENHPMWCDMYNILGEAGVISAVATSNSFKNVDITGDVPSNCSSPYTIVVTSSDYADQIVRAYGPTHVDISAPGENVFMSNINNNYSTSSGTSYATPQISGTIALLNSINAPIFSNNDNPSSTALTVKNAILDSARKVDGLETLISSGGILDLKEAYNELSQNTISENRSIIENLYPNPASTVLMARINISLDESYSVTIYNSMGQIVFIENIAFGNLGENQFSLNIENWPTGQYIISLVTDTTKNSKKFVKN